MLKTFKREKDVNDLIDRFNDEELPDSERLDAVNELADLARDAEREKEAERNRKIQVWVPVITTALTVTAQVALTIISLNYQKQQMLIGLNFERENILASPTFREARAAFKIKNLL